jgi:F-type H+-transporting ATPase subunit gamma
VTNPKELRERIRNIATIERTVDALQKISAARLARERQALLAARPYTAAVVDIVSELAAGGLSHPLLDSHEGKGYMLVVIGSDRGMCGSYNSNIMRAAVEFVASRHREKLYLVTAGTKLRRFRPHTKALIIRETLRYPRPLVQMDAEELARKVIDAYLHKDVARIYLLYTEFRGVSGSRPAVRRILPLLPPPAAPHEQIFEPGPGQLLDSLMPQYVLTAVRAAFQEASASEHAARMITMEQASVSTRKMIAGRRLAANRLRQMTITRELLDIIGTSEALA